MTSSERWPLAAIVAVAASAFVTVASAQPAPPPLPAPAPSAAPQDPTAANLETARVLYKEGKELRAAGNLTEALVKLKAAHQLGRTPITGIELARTYEMLHQLVEAREVCLDVARIPVASDETERSVTARTDAATLAEELRARVATLVVHLAGVPPGASVTLMIDKSVVPPAAVSELHRVNPGTHEIAAKIEGGAAVTTTAEVKEGETRDVSLTVPPPPVVHSEPPKKAPPPPPPADEKPHRNALATTGFVIGGIGVTVGALTGLLALSKKSDLDAVCGANKAQCPGTSQDDLDSAKSWATFSTVAFVVGGLGAAVGIFALVGAGSSDAPREGASVYVGPGSVGVHGSF